MDVEPAEVCIEQVAGDMIPVIAKLNRDIFGEERVIHSFDRKNLLLLLAMVDNLPVGFKVGYSKSERVFYSAKGGVLPEFRGDGVARVLLYSMMDHAREQGFRRFAFDTFPNKDPGMTILGLKEEFRVVKANYNSLFEDYRLRFEKDL